MNAMEQPNEYQGIAEGDVLAVGPIDDLIRFTVHSVDEDGRPSDLSVDLNPQIACLLGFRLISSENVLNLKSIAALPQAELAALRTSAGWKP